MNRKRYREVIAVYFLYLLIRAKAHGVAIVFRHQPTDFLRAFKALHWAVGHFFVKIFWSIDMNHTTTIRGLSHNTTALEQICQGLVHLRKKKMQDRELVLKMHEGFSKVVAGQLRMRRAFETAVQAA